MLETLHKLGDTRDSLYANRSLVHYFVEMLESEFPNVLRFKEELHSLDPASRVSIAEVRAEVAALRKGLKLMRDELEYFADANHSLEPGDGFVSQMRPFHERAEATFSKLESKLGAMETAFKVCVEYFGEDSTTSTPEAFFGIFRQFVATVERSQADLRAMELKEEQERKKEANRLYLSNRKQKRPDGAAAAAGTCATDGAPRCRRGRQRSAG